MPIVVGFRLDGEMPRRATATDLVLNVTEMLRAHGVVGKFVEFHGPGLSRLGLADRATISNMSPEFGATATMFPIDDETLRYLRMTGRPDEVIARVEAYAKAQGLFRTDDSPGADVQRVARASTCRRSCRRWPGRSGRRTGSRSRTCATRSAPRSPTGSTPTPMDNARARGRRRRRAGTVDEASAESFPAPDPPSYTRDPRRSPRQPAAAPARAGAPAGGRALPGPEVRLDGERHKLRTGSVVIAAITSCTNTSNPSVMVAAGLLARNAVARGLDDEAVGEDLARAGLAGVTDYLRAPA